MGEVVEIRPFSRVGFLGAHQLVFDFDVALGIQNGQAGTVAGAIFGDIGEIRACPDRPGAFSAGQCAR